MSLNFVSCSPHNDRKGLQEQDRFANPTTITESMGNFCLKLIILPEKKAKTHVVLV